MKRGKNSEHDWFDGAVALSQFVGGSFVFWALALAALAALLRAEQISGNQAVVVVLIVAVFGLSVVTVGPRGLRRFKWTRGSKQQSIEVGANGSEKKDANSNH